jgi:hypothetical protein
MILKLNDRPVIENLRHYPPATVDELRHLLAHGAPAIPDSHRQAFYEVEDGEHVYYVHICPNGNVLLLARWHKEGGQASTSLQ